MRLALTDLFRARWSNDIHREWMEAVVRKKPHLQGKLEKTRSLMDKHVRDCLVTGYESLISGLKLPDPDDRHVLAAAIRTQAELIITRNHRDFPAHVLEPYGIKTLGPDDFIMDLLDLNRKIVLTTMKGHQEILINPKLTPEEYCQYLNRQALEKTESFVRSAWGIT